MIISGINIFLCDALWEYITGPAFNDWYGLAGYKKCSESGED